MASTYFATTAAAADAGIPRRRHLATAFAGVEALRDAVFTPASGMRRHPAVDDSASSGRYRAGIFLA